jgi:mRNA interferase RelE/StbE
MDLYNVLVDSRAKKAISHFPPKHVRQIKEALERLRVSPRPHDNQKLSRGYRITVGEYRVLYTVDDEAKVVTVYKIVKRNDYSYRE